MTSAETQLRKTRRIALLEPVEELGESVGHALQLFDSMLWVFRGTTRSNWNLCSAAEADVVVLHRAEAAQRVEELRDKGKVIVVLSTDASATALGDHMLVYPFPAATVLGLLERLDVQLDGRNAAPPKPHVTAAKETGHTAHELVEVIRTVREARNAELWLAIHDAAEPLLWLRGDGAVYQANAAVRTSLRCGALHARTLVTKKVPAPPPGLENAPGDELAWFAGYHASSTLASWLTESERYRLRRWPDFGLLRAPDALTMACQLRVVAALDAQPATPAKLVMRARVTRMQIARTLNALSMCGLIEADAGSAVPAPRAEFVPARPEGGFRQLLRGLRKHLQLRSAS